jgi:predicted DsbA family dithiol-disulfide isomerase
MTQRLRIDFVSDIACPWCAIGLFGLEQALKRTAGEVQADIHFQPFELNPNMPRQGENLDEHIAHKYGAAPQQLEASRRMLRERAADVGFAFNQRPDSRIYNTFDAHRLLHWAGTLDAQLQWKLKQALFRANFTDNADITDPQVLIAAASTAGLDTDAARQVLDSQRYADEVRQTEKLWLSRGIHAVPGMVINEKWLISGGQSADVLEQALRNIAAEVGATAPAPHAP